MPQANDRALSDPFVDTGLVYLGVSLSIYNSKAIQSRFAVYRHRLHAILKTPFIIHYLSLSCESTQNVKIFNSYVKNVYFSRDAKVGKHR